MLNKFNNIIEHEKITVSEYTFNTLDDEWRKWMCYKSQIFRIDENKFKIYFTEGSLSVKFHFDSIIQEQVKETIKKLLNIDNDIIVENTWGVGDDRRISKMKIILDAIAKNHEIQRRRNELEDEALNILASGNMDEIDQLTKIYQELDKLQLIPYDGLQYNLTDAQEKELRKTLGLSVQ